MSGIGGGPEDVAAHYRAAIRFAAGLIAGAGACILAVSLVMTWWPAPDWQSAELLVLGLAVIAVGASLLALGGRFWPLRHILLPAVSGAIVFGQWFLTDGQGLAPVFFLWIGLWIYMFLSKRDATIHTIILLVAVAAVFAVPDRYPTAFAYWIFIASTIAVTAIVVRRLVATAQLAAEKERQAKQALAELNRTLEARVEEQVEEMGKLARLRRFLSPQIAQALITHGEDALQPHRREIAAVFCDLRGFTAFSSEAEPEDVTALLTEFHQALDVLVQEYGATVGHFAGDGVMLYFNDPIPCDDPAQRAVRLALDLGEPMRRVAAKWSARGYNIAYGVGIALGYATLGVIGFDARADYTALGSVVNLAARLSDEAAPGEVLLDLRAHAAVQTEFEFGTVRELELKGISRPVAVHNVLSAKS